MTNTQKEVKENKKAANAPKRHKMIAIVEGLVIGTVVVLAIGFTFGVKYANTQHEEVKAAVSALRAPKQ